MARNAPGRTEPSNPSIEVVHLADESAENSPVDRPQPIVGQEDVAPAPISTSSGATPEPLMPPGTAIEVDTVMPPAWRMPVYARYRLLSIGAVIMSTAWLLACGAYILEGFTFPDLLALLPHELGGMAAGVVTPLAFLWVVVAYFERSKIYEKEAFALRWHLNQLTFPSDDAHFRTAEISNVLRAQAKVLTHASEEASDRAQAASDLIRVQTSSLVAASEKASLNADSAGEKLRQQAEDLVNASDRAIARAREAGNVLHLSLIHI